MSFPPISAPRPPKATAAYVYDANHAQQLLSIIDLDEADVPSVTNDLAHVLADIAHEQGLAGLAGWGVTYRDTEGDWCRVVLRPTGELEQICGFGQRVTSECEALARMWSLVA